MMHDSPTINRDVTLRHRCDLDTCPAVTSASLARVARSDSTPTPLKNVQRGAAPDLWEEPEKGPRLAEPDAARRQEPPTARSARATSPTATFRRACAFARCYSALTAAQLRDLANTTGLEIPDNIWPRVLAVVAYPLRRTAPTPATWRDRCAHTPKCTTPTQCELRADREGR